MSFNYTKPKMYSPPAESPFLNKPTKTNNTMFNTLGQVASSLIGGAFNMIGQNKQLRDQERANNISFQQNKHLAQLQNQYNIEQWNRENQYNLPINQIKRLRDAGLSPTLMYGNGTSGLTAGTSPSMSAGTPISPVDYTMGGHRATIGDIIQGSLDTAYQSAQINLLKSQTNKTNEDTKGVNIDNQTKYQQNIATLEKTLTDIGIGKEKQKEIVANTQKIYAELPLISANIDQIRTAIKNDTDRVALERIRTGLEQQFQSYRIKESMARVNLSNAQRKEILDTLSNKVLLLAKQANLTQAQTNESVSRDIINVLQQEKVIAETDALVLQNIINTPDALKAQALTESFKTSFLGTNGAEIRASLDLLYEFLHVIAEIIPG